MNAQLFTRFAAATVGVALTCSLVDVNPAEAASFTTFNFNGSDQEYTTVPSFDFTVNGLDLNVTATSEDGTNQVRRTVGGLGVYDGLGRGREIDAAGGLLETLSFNFGETVRLVSAKFGFADTNDTFNLSVGGNSVLNGQDIPDDNTYNFDFAQITANTFSFTANLGSSYSLQSITVASVASVASVPEPTTVLGLMAVGAFGSLSLKRKS